MSALYAGAEGLPSESHLEGTYWADLPFKKRTRWIWQQQDPLEPFVMYWKRYVISGLGIFTAGYVLFSIANIHVLFQQSYGPCWQRFEECSQIWTQTTDYFQVVGIILGQLTVGFLGDWLGRRWGMIQDAVIMFIGCLMLAVANGTTANGWVIMYAISQLVFGFGVGGEYPMTGAQAAEKEVPGSKADMLHRGRNVALAFTMQGWGQLVNLGVLMVGLLAFNSKGSGPYSHGAAGATYRFSFGFIAVLVLWMAYYRTWRMKPAKGPEAKPLRGAGGEKDAKQGRKAAGYDGASFRLLITHFWHRLIGTSLGWFCNDFLFYGNATFRNRFISVLTGTNSSVMEAWLWNLLNVGVALVGYHAAALSIDWKWWGRVRMQATGFLACFVLFLLPACIYGPLTGSASGIKAFQFIYFFSSFWNQFGPNCTTFLVAAEVYPSSVRSTAHGMSAAVGKLGALAPTILFNYISDRAKFWAVCWAGLLGFFVTVVFVPDATGLSMLEQEQSWELIQQGRPKDYHGVAVHPRHLSVFERVILKRHHQYQPKAQQLPSHTAQTSMAAVNGGLSSTGVDNKQTARDSEAA
ncbi:hypothetical protein ABBQ32_006450 [Trebouxia sp. C0010 RCD-2024]